MKVKILSGKLSYLDQHDIWFTKKKIKNVDIKFSNVRSKYIVLSLYFFSLYLYI